MQSSPSTVYSQSIDKQRIVVVGKTNSRIVEMILFVLNLYKRKVDYSTPIKEKISDSPLIVIEPDHSSNSAADYNHHIVIFSQLSPGEKTVYSKLVDATPKSGIIIFEEGDPIAREITKVERTDIFLNPVAMPKHDISTGKIVLISGTNEKVLTQLSNKDDLINLSLAKEVLKKVGTSSGQFYKAISSFQ